MSNDNRYFYVNNCKEFIALMNQWCILPCFKSSKQRIIVLDDFDKLKTNTAKIVFLFNLILDMADLYNDFRLYMSIVSPIDNNYIDRSNNYLVDNSKNLNKAATIAQQLSETTNIFEPYKIIIAAILLDFSNINNEILQIGQIVLNLLAQRQEQSEIIEMIDPSATQLVNLTDVYSKHLLDLQNVINQNDITFTYLKQIDNETWR